MNPEQKSKLEPFADQIEEWFDVDHKSVREAQKELAQLGCQVDASWLGKWWRARKAQRLEEQLLALITHNAHRCQELEKAFNEGQAPELDLLIKLHRTLILDLCTQATANPALINRVTEMMKTVFGWAALQEKSRLCELAEQKYRDQVAAQKAALERELNAAKASGGINPETFERVERELKLL